MFYIFDTQCYNYVGDGREFSTLEEACLDRIDYHDIDIDMTYERELLEQGKVKECWRQLEGFDWRLHDKDTEEEVDINSLAEELIK